MKHFISDGGIQVAMIFTLRVSGSCPQWIRRTACKTCLRRPEAQGRGLPSVDNARLYTRPGLFHVRPLPLLSERRRQVRPRPSRTTTQLSLAP